MQTALPRPEFESFPLKKALGAGISIEETISVLRRAEINFYEARLVFEKRWIAQVLEEHHGNQSHAARELGMHRNTLARYIEDLKINVRGMRPSPRSYTRRKPRSKDVAAQAASARPSLVNLRKGELGEITTADFRGPRQLESIHPDPHADPEVSGSCGGLS